MNEIERKFLIRMPEKAQLLLKEGANTSSITQTYLQGEVGYSERVRKREFSDHIVYTHTKKRFISALSCEEIEEEISEEAYLRLLHRKDPARTPVSKERICIPYAGHLLEIDIYPFWKKQAVLEVELRSESEECLLPSYLSVLREVTGDKKYKNKALAISVPEEDA